MPQDERRSKTGNSAEANPSENANKKKRGQADEKRMSKQRVEGNDPWLVSERSLGHQKEAWGAIAKKA